MEKQTNIFTPRFIAGVAFFIVLQPLSPLLISQHWNWLEAWIYAAVYISSYVISRIIAARRTPDIMLERSRILAQEDAKAWDKQLLPIWGLGIILIPVVAGFDARFAWSPMAHPYLKIFSLIIFIAGILLSSYALIENRFFSGMVRIQTERNHHVISSGPYRWMRHPGYAGAILYYLATPLLLDSLWAFLPAIFLTIIIVIRTRLEDQTLHNELEGYAEYAQHVPYRLLPGLW